MSIPLGALPNRLTLHARAVSGQDIYGNDVRGNVTDFETPARVDIASATEELTDREEQRVRYDVIVPPGLTIDGWDSATWEDYPGGPVELEADGPFEPVYDSTSVHHLEGPAKRTRG